jgi:excisionase family DNA binding protein
MPDQPTKRLLTPDEAAELLGVEVQTLAVWRTTGRYGLPFVTVGRSVRYKAADIEKWIERNTVGAKVS